jgi:hypothetical protein
LLTHVIQSDIALLGFVENRLGVVYMGIEIQNISSDRDQVLTVKFRGEFNKSGIKLHQVVEVPGVMVSDIRLSWHLLKDQILHFDLKLLTLSEEKKA